VGDGYPYPVTVGSLLDNANAEGAIVDHTDIVRGCFLIGNEHYLGCGDCRNQGVTLCNSYVVRKPAVSDNGKRRQYSNCGQDDDQLYECKALRRANYGQ